MSSISNEPTEIDTNPRYDHIAVALKSGKDIALDRTLIQLLTFLKIVKNKILIGDANISIGRFHMVNVIQNQTRIQKRDGRQVIPNEESPGWANDAKKNIQGFSVLYDTFPTAEWFIMIDDDTYLFMENLRWFLKRYDSNQPFYFGVATSFRGCDGVTELGQGPYFAHGGSGIVLSRGALLKMLQIKDTCIQKYSSCWAGDIRTALCLRDAGVLLMHSPRFHGSPPNNHANFQHPCSRPISFHHLFPSQIQQLYELERKGVKRLSEIAPRFLDVGIQLGLDRPKHTFKTIDTIDSITCQSQCRLDSKCLSFAYRNGTCELKDGISAIQKDTTVSSGVMLEHYECYPWQQLQHS